MISAEQLHAWLAPRFATVEEAAEYQRRTLEDMRRWIARDVRWPLRRRRGKAPSRAAKRRRRW